MSVLDDVPTSPEGKFLLSRQWIEESDRWIASMVERLDVSLESLVPLTDEEYQDALYDDYLQKERERLVHHT